MLFFRFILLTMSIIGIGLIGTGFMGKAHAIAFNSVSAVFGDILRPRLRLLCDVDAERTQRKAEEFGFDRWTTDWREVMTDDSGMAPAECWRQAVSRMVGKNGIRIELHGSKGTIVFEQERMNELELYVAEERKDIVGFRRILTGPEHPPYGLFCQAPGHSLGFNDLKIIEVAHLLNAIAGKERPFPTFGDGVLIERVIHGIAESAARRL